MQSTPQTPLSVKHVYKHSVSEFLALADTVVQAAGGTPRRPSGNADSQVWLDELTDAAVRGLSPLQQTELLGFRDFLESLAWMRGEYSRLRSADPGAFYVPAHNVALEFHQSLAKWRLFTAGNRCSKTQSGLQDDYWVATNQHPYRGIPFRDQAVAIVGTTYKKYSIDVFEPKMIVGEAGNELSPYFPEGGKWLHRYDKRAYRITTACPECAGAGRADKCSPMHKGRGTISLYSDEGGSSAIMGAQFTQLHLDEHVDESFFIEGNQRLGTVSHSGGIITGSPLYGPDVFEYRIVAARAKGPPELNKKDPENPKSPDWANYFQISQLEAGLRSKSEIEADAKSMPDHEYQARVLGIPTAVAERPVFDGAKISLARKIAQTAEKPKIGRFRCDVPIEVLFEQDKITFGEVGTGSTAIWEPPDPSGQYIVGVDTASGLTPGDKLRVPDASCAAVHRLFDVGGKVRMRKVAEFHGYERPNVFAEEVKKLGVYYNMAWLVVETTGGLGAAVLERLRTQIFYPKIFVDKSRPQQTEVNFFQQFGVSTTQNTKPLMIAAMQAMWSDDRLEVHHVETLTEMAAFTQKESKAGNYFKYEAAPGAKDDRVLATAFACYAIVTNPVLYEFPDSQAERQKDRRHLSDAAQNSETHFIVDEQISNNWNIWG